MSVSFNPSSLFFYTIFAWLLGICYGFVLISSAAGQNGEVDLFRPGDRLVYKVHSTVLLNEVDDSAKNVGFYIAGDLLVHSLWGLDNDRILKIELRAPRLNIRSRKAPSPDGFIEHTSKLDEFPLKPFFLVWKKGKVDQVLLPKDDPVYLANLKKGIASLFQFQILDVETYETDSSGHCSIKYEFFNENQFRKIKSNCQSVDLPYVTTNSEAILSTIVNSSRVVTYELDPLSSYVKTIHAKESHQIYLAAKDDLGSSIVADQMLTYVRTDQTKTLEGASIDTILSQIESKENYVHDSLLLVKEPAQEEPKTFISSVNEMREQLLEKNVGTLASAKAFVRLVEVARVSNKEDISKTLAAKKNQKILAQIYDILGHVQILEVHRTVLKKLHFEKEEHLDLSERYLWALSMAPNPNPEIVTDLLTRYRKSDSFPEKVQDTLILTVAAMSHRLLQMAQAPKVRLNVEETILNSLDYAKEERRYIFLRALKNLKSESTIPVLLDIIRNGTTKEGVLAFKALRSFSPKIWNASVIKTAKRAFLQLDRKYDSSCRTLAIDILLESNPTDETLHDFLIYLKSNDSSYEVKQYLFQRIQMIGDQDHQFLYRVLAIIKSDSSLNNYSTLSPRGLSTALKRNFLNSPACNGSLLTIQEIFGGIVKRGIVDVVLDKNNESKELISLGIFAGGLGSFVSSDSDDNEEETTTAGIELTVLGTQIRPFVFFNGQGELMGHIWSGTASTKTTAFQALALLQDHLEYLRLAPGFVAELNLKSAMSFDLSGKIEISIWSRTADSLVEKSAGLLTIGSVKIDTSFIRSQVEFTASVEPKLSLQSDIETASNVNLCMRVTQPDSLFRHNIFKIERIPGSKHKLRIAKYKKSVIPGTTYSLNRKNNEMCSAMLSR